MMNLAQFIADGILDAEYIHDRGEIELIDNAGNPYAADPVSVVRLP
jgi:hypothetical protein